ncbi:MAG: hypothetical protein WC827_00925 [Candidatus Paceibacterota bacterium]
MKKPKLSPLRKETMAAIKSYQESKKLPDEPFPRSSRRRPVTNRRNKNVY